MIKPSLLFRRNRLCCAGVEIQKLHRILCKINQHFIASTVTELACMTDVLSTLFITDFIPVSVSRLNESYLIEWT